MADNSTFVFFHEICRTFSLRSIWLCWRADNSPLLRADKLSTVSTLTFHVLASWKGRALTRRKVNFFDCFKFFEYIFFCFWLVLLLTLKHFPVIFLSFRCVRRYSVDGFECMCIAEGKDSVYCLMKSKITDQPILSVRFSLFIIPTCCVRVCSCFICV